MKLSDLLAKHSHYYDKLNAAIEAHADDSEIRELDRSISRISDVIKNVHASSVEEISIQIKFFLNRSANPEHSDLSISSYDLDAVNILVDRYANVAAVVDQKSENNSLQIPTSTLQKDVFKSGIEFIQENPSARISLFNTEYEYQSTTASNANFNKMELKAFETKHLVEVVGGRRFENRAKQYYDRCLAGAEQKYNYVLDVPDLGSRLMRCQLNPYRDGDGAVRGLYFFIDDITDDLFAPPPHINAPGIVQ